MSAAVDPVRILIVDDSEDQLLLLQRYFERAGCAVEIAGSAFDALELFRARTPDLTVIDLYMPGMDGWELAAQLTTEVPETPIAITSVLGTTHYPTEHAALPKPVTGAHVRSALEQLVPRWSTA
jgi:CheY-like chemotaxis protein